jgi:hypothetical protein
MTTDYIPLEVAGQSGEETGVGSIMDYQSIRTVCVVTLWGVSSVI